MMSFVRAMMMSFVRAMMMSFHCRKQFASMDDSLKEEMRKERRRYNVIILSTVKPVLRGYPREHKNGCLRQMTS